MPSWHAKFSASSMSRIEKCPGSVELSAGIPSRDTIWSIEGTKAHAVLETITKNQIADAPWMSGVLKQVPDASGEMIKLGKQASDFIIGQFYYDWHKDKKIAVESKITLPWIHDDIGGTYDSKIFEFFGTLHIFDYKFGVAAVSPFENLQMLTYSIGEARKHNWNFEKARHWIIQPRIRGYDGPTFWDCSARELQLKWEPKLRSIVNTAIKYPKKYVEGSHCHFCNAKSKCPLKRDAKEEKARAAWQS